MNAEKVVLRFPNDTTVDISGDAFVVQQIIARLDGLIISFEHRTTLGFGKSIEEPKS